MLDIVVIIIAYLLGSLSAGFIISRLLNLPDPTTIGSGNPGATNILRSSGKKVAIVVLILDLLKGTVAVVIAQQLHLSTLLISLTALAAFLGHLYPVFFGFKGGKGVATALGVLFPLSPLLAALLLLTWLLLAFTLRYSSLAALVAAFLMPLYAYLLLPPLYLPSLLAMAVLLIGRHHGNIQRLLAGSEPKIGQKSEA